MLPSITLRVVGTENDFSRIFRQCLQHHPPNRFFTGCLNNFVIRQAGGIVVDIRIAMG